MNKTNKTIGFASDLVPLVLDGSKTLTYRLGDKYDFLQIGDRILTDNSGTGKVFAELEITHKEKGTFGTLRDDREGHEMYRTPEERRATFEEYYKRPVSDDEQAIILGFKVVRRVNDKNQNAVHIYNKIAEDYAKTYDAIDGEEDLIFLQKFLATLTSKSHILDIGCGTGFSAGFFVQNGMQAEDIDLAESMIAIAKRNYPNITFTVADILEYAPAAPVDAVWAGYSLFHFTQEDFEKALEKVKTYLKPSGVFGLVMQEGEGEIEVPEPFAPEETIYLHLYSERELKDILGRHGFEIIEVARKAAKETKEFFYNKLLFIVKPHSI